MEHFVSKQVAKQYGVTMRVVDKSVIVSNACSNVFDITMVDLKGAVVYRRNATGRNQIFIPTQNIRSGIYLVNIKTDNAVFFVR